MTEDTLKLVKSYNKINKILYNLKYILKEKTADNKRCKKTYISGDKREIEKIIKYINIYNGIFMKNLNRLEEEERNITTGIFIGGRNIKLMSAEEYISIAKIYRVLNKFKIYFICDLANNKGIIKPLLRII